MNRASTTVLTLITIGIFGLLGFAILTASASAAEPATGTVSKSSRVAKWSGQSTVGATTTFTQIFTNNFGLPTGTICQAPSCDTYTLTVADAGEDLTVVTNTAIATITYVEVVKPDGGIVYVDGIDEEGKEDKKTTVKIKNAPAGDYTVKVAVNALTDESYTGTASLVAPPAPAPDAEVPAAPAPAQPAPAEPAKPAASISISTSKASLRKLKGRLPVSLSSTAPLTAVTVALRQGTKTIAVAKLAKVDGAARATLRPKRMPKPGRFTIVVTGRSADGTAVGAKAPLKLSR